MNRAVYKVNSLFDTFRTTEDLYNYLEGKLLRELVKDMLNYNLSQEDFEAVRVIADDIHLIFADGKLTWDDVIPAISMVTNVTSLVQSIITKIDKEKALDIHTYRPIIKLISSYLIVYYIKADRNVKMMILAQYLRAYDPIIKIATGLAFKVKGWSSKCCDSNESIDQPSVNSKDLMEELKVAFK